MGITRDSIARALSALTAKIRTKEFADGLVNPITGVGTERSKGERSQYQRSPLLDPWLLETLFQDNDLARKIVAKPVEDALRAGFSLKRKNGSPQDDQDDAAEILKEYKKLTIESDTGRSIIARGATFGRLLGGAGVIIAAAGGGPLSAPLKDEDVKSVEFLVAWDRQDMMRATYALDGKVATFLWTRPTQGDKAYPPEEVHVSRLLWFPGALTTTRARIENEGWDHSVLQAVYAVLRSFDNMFKSTDALFQDASQAVFRLQGLISSLAEADGTGASNVQTRLQLMDLTRSAVKAIMLDAGDETGAGKEEFEVVERPMLGAIDGTMMQYYIRLAAAAGMPLTVLLGMAPSGMDATGDSDMELYFNTVDVYRKEVLEPLILRLIHMIARSLGHEGPDEWELCWPELSRPKPLDVATTEKMRMDCAVAAITSQVVLPEEVALSMNTIAPSLGLVIDIESRKAALEAGLQEVENREVGMGKMEAEAELETKKATAVAKAKPAAGPAQKTSARKVKAKTAGRQT
jgi:phage-related protein (TIGR01555 family)